MRWSEKGDFKVFKKCCLQEMRREYRNGSGPGKKLCDKMESVSEFSYLGDKLNAGEGCEAADTARTRCGWLSLGSVVRCCIVDFP